MPPGSSTSGWHWTVKGALRSSISTISAAVQPDEHRHLDEDRQATAQRIVVVLAEQFLLGLGPGLGVALVLLLELLDLRLQQLHLLVPAACFKLSGNMHPRTSTVSRMMASP